MKHRMIALLLALCLCVGLLPLMRQVPAASAAEATLEESINMDQLVAHGISMYRTLEAGGQYNSVINTSACVGMGIAGWIGSSALQLLKWTCAKDPAYSQSVLGDDLYNEVVNAPVAYSNATPWTSTYLMPPWSYWQYRKFSSAEIAAAKTLLGSPVGIQAQNDLAGAYLRTQAQHGWNAGVRTEAGLLYYCSAENHYGEYGVKSFMTQVRNALGISNSDLITSLNMFHRGAVAANVSTLTYRTKVYNYLVNTLHLNPDADPITTIPFTDLPEEGHWAHDPIVWAYTANPQITNGTSDTTFSPYATVTRGEAVTFLWRAAGCPAPASSYNPFADVSSSQYYYKPVLWAVEKGITNGTSDTTFSPNDPVSRKQMITFLWRFANEPAPGGAGTNPFTDLSSEDYAYRAILWAYWGGILVGNESSDPATLLPNADCFRAYVVTYLYNLFVQTAH